VPEAGPEGLAAVRVVFQANRVDPDYHRHEREEWIYVLSGRLRLTLGEESTVLEPGDAAYFTGMMAHSFEVLGDRDAEVLMVAGARRGTPHPFYTVTASSSGRRRLWEPAAKTGRSRSRSLAEPGSRRARSCSPRAWWTSCRRSRGSESSGGGECITAPNCHGWEVRDRPLALYAQGEKALEKATMIRNWSRDLVILSDGPLGIGREERERLRLLGVGVREEQVSHLEGAPDGEGLERVVFEDGSYLEREAVFCAPPQRQRSELAEILGCALVDAGPGRVVENDATTKETSVPGVYVAGDAGQQIQSVILAAASGAGAAYSINNALTFEDAARDTEGAARA
jgi:hypothetical protein